MMFPTLRKDLIQHGQRSVVRVGEKSIDYAKTFMLYLSTRDSTIVIPPTASSLLTIINFTVTRSGLEGQLLSIIINYEQPELEKRKTESLQNEE